MSNVDSMPALELTNPDHPSIEPGLVELEIHRDAGLLAQMEIASCLRGHPEPMLHELSPLTHTQHPNDSV